MSLWYLSLSFKVTELVCGLFKRLCLKKHFI